MVKKISVAFQGGGAKVVELIAAANALSALTKDKLHGEEIQVVRVAGASAGAIAASLFATGANFENILEKAATLDAELQQHFSSDKLRLRNIAWRLVRNKPVFEEAHLRNLIVSLFNLGGVQADQMIATLMGQQDHARCPELRILAASMYETRKITYDETQETQLATALVNSAAIPFIFRTPKSNETPEIVDGGLFQNLPADAALDDLPDDVIPIAVSFEDETVTPSGDDSIRSYAGKLINTLIRERVKDAKLQFHPDYIIDIKSSRGSLNFDSMFGDDFRSAFLDAKAAALNGFRGRLGAFAPDLEPDWHSTTPRDLITQFTKIESDASWFAEAVTNDQAITADLLRHEVIPMSLFTKEDNRADTYRFVIRIEGAKNPGLQFFTVRFYDSDTGALRAPKIEVRSISKKDGSPGEKWNVFIFPFRNKDKRERTLLACLERPLKEGDYIEYIKTEESYESLKRYKTKGDSFEGIKLNPNRDVGRIEIIHHFPEKWSPKVHRNVQRQRQSDSELAREKLDDPGLALINLNFSTDVSSCPGLARIPQFSCYAGYSDDVGDIQKIRLAGVVYER